ncbi:MAG: hypothetical protein WC915_03870 [archaeon]|jgi:hypothetical protein
MVAGKKGGNIQKRKNVKREDFSKQLRELDVYGKRELAEAVADGVLTANQARGMLSGQLKKIREVQENGKKHLSVGNFDRAAQSFLLAARNSAKHDFFESEAASLKLALDALRKANAPVEQRKVVMRKFSDAVAKVGDMELKLKRLGI